jgi:biotin carboxylase
MKIMILGGSSNQIDMIKKVKEAGDTAILVDYLDDCPGKALADIHLPISTFDTEAITRAAKEYQVDGIVTSGTDQPVLSAAIASEKLGLNFYVTAEVAKAVTNKKVMKKNFKDHTIPSVAYRLIKKEFKDDELDGLNFPIVLKPVDCQGQRGIYLLNSIEEIRNKIDDTLSFSRENEVLVEEYYKNDEITVNGWVNDGTVTLLSVVARVTINRDQHIGICLCHNFPSVHLKKHHNDIEKLTQHIVNSFNIKNGPLYFQYLVGAQGIKVNEIAMRIGGAYEGLTIPMIAGVDILQMVLDTVKYQRCDTSNLTAYSLAENTVCLSTQLFFCHPGKIASVTPISDIARLSGVKAMYYIYTAGDVIPMITNATARAGYFIVKGSSFNQMIENVNNVFNTMKILSSTGNNLLIKYEDYENKYSFNQV